MMWAVLEFVVGGSARCSEDQCPLCAKIDKNIGAVGDGKRILLIIRIIMYGTAKVSQLIRIEKGMIKAVAVPECFIDDQNNSFASNRVINSRGTSDNRNVTNRPKFFGIAINISDAIGVI